MIVTMTIPIRLRKRPARTICGIVIWPVAKTMAFGGVATGSMKAQLAAMVIGTVKGDMHSIGKDLVATILKIGGFEVTDLGVDVPTFTFLEQAEKANADIIALSALLTTTMPAQREIIDALKDQGERDKFRIMIGGAPVNQGWADKIGADAYGDNAAQAVKLAEKLCG